MAARRCEVHLKRRWRYTGGIRRLARTVDFPEHLNRYAGFGSKYWNRNHKKIQSIVAALKELQRLDQYREMPDDISTAYDHLTSRNYNPFETPSRVADYSLAISLPNKLLDLAREVSISSECHLSLDDFYPGTVNGYLSPYEYPLESWASSETSFGIPYLSSTPVRP